MTIEHWKHACAHVASRYGVTKSTPGLYYTLTASVYERMGAGEEIAGWPADATFIRAYVRVTKLVEASYPDYGWTKFVRDADDAMWDKALAPMRAFYPGKVAEHGGKPLKVQEGGYLHAHGSYDAELERFDTHDALAAHLTHIFSGQPHTDKRGATVHLHSRAEALAARDDLTSGDPFATNDARKASGDYYRKQGAKPKHLAYLPGPVRDHITKVIDQHFPA